MEIYMDLGIIQGLWWPKLTTMEQLSVSSYLRNGHTYHLYAYGEVAGLPDGAVLKDASEILPESEVKRFSRIAQFADYFRYKLLYERGGWWTDMDVVCLKPLDFEAEHVFSSEYDKDTTSSLNNVVIKAPVGSPIMAWALEECRSVNPATIGYVALGPSLMNRAIAKFGFEKYVAPPTVFCPIPWWEWRRYIKEPAPALPPDTYAIHFWHEMWRTERQDTGAEYPSGCLYEQLKRGFSIPCSSRRSYRVPMFRHSRYALNSLRNWWRMLRSGV
jgi:Glycosyltransferase sugar-binding region containing DXD motif/Alpha 1,4-glycosyltransferase conserved region